MLTQQRAHQSNPTSSMGGVLQRKCACGGTPGATGECESCKKKREAREGRLQRKASSLEAVNEVPEIVHEVLRSPGQPLETGTRGFMESRFGYDFSNVRVHTNSKAAESARAVNANAYAVGHNIVFGSGQFTPDELKGRRLIAHELTHVIQQSGADQYGAETTVQRAARNDLSRTPTPERSSASIRLNALAARLETGLQQATDTQPVSEVAANSEHSNAIKGIPTFLSQIRAAADSNDEALKQSILAAFTPQYLKEATAQAKHRISSVNIQEQSQGIATKSLEISNPQDAAEREAVRVSEAVISGGRDSIIVATNPRILHRDGRASAALAALIVTETEALPVEAASGPLGWVIAGVALLAIAGLVIYVATSSSSSETAAVGTGIAATTLSSDSPTSTEQERQRRCQEQHPDYQICNDPRNVYDVARSFAVSRGIAVSSIDCQGLSSFMPGSMDDCSGSPGENWQCTINDSEFVVSLNGCLCCNTAGGIGFNWHPHQSPGDESGRGRRRQEDTRRERRERQDRDRQRRDRRDQSDD